MANRDVAELSSLVLDPRNVQRYGQGEVTAAHADDEHAEQAIAKYMVEAEGPLRSNAGWRDGYLGNEWSWSVSADKFIVAEGNRQDNR